MVASNEPLLSFNGMQIATAFEHCRIHVFALKQESGFDKSHHAVAKIEVDEPRLM